MGTTLMDPVHDNWLSEYFRAKRIIVTGAAGFIGSNVVARFRNVDCHVTRVLRRPAELSVPATAQIKDIIGDVRDARLWMEILPGADIVYHLASQTSGSVAEADPESDFRNNVLPMLHMLEACERVHVCPSIIFSSTATVFGFPHRLPVDDTLPDEPATVYDRDRKSTRLNSSH